MLLNTYYTYTSRFPGNVCTHNSTLVLSEDQCLFCPVA